MLYEGPPRLAARGAAPQRLIAPLDATMTQMLLNLLAFQAAWWACVAGAGRGLPWLGPIVTLAVVAIRLLAASRPLAEVRMLLVVAGTGYATDVLLTLTDVVRYETHALSPWPTPAWMLALWLAFGTTLNVSLAWLGARPVLAGVLGAVAGPSAYLAGQALGAFELPRPQFATIAIIAAQWAAMLPLAGAIAARSRRIPTPSARVDTCEPAPLRAARASPVAERQQGPPERHP